MAGRFRASRSRAAGRSPVRMPCLYDGTRLAFSSRHASRGAHGCRLRRVCARFGDPCLVRTYWTAHQKGRRRRECQLALAQQPSVGAVGLGPPLAAPRCLGIGRLRQVRLEPRGLDLFDHVTPPGAALHRQRHRPAVGHDASRRRATTDETGPIRLSDPAPPHLAGLPLGRAERDLPSMQIQPTYHRHQGPPHSCSGTGQTQGCPRTNRGGPHTLNVWGPSGHEWKVATSCSCASVSTAL